MGRLLRKKKKKKAGVKKYRHDPETLSKSRPRLPTVLSERIVTALSDSITSFASVRNLGSQERKPAMSYGEIIDAEIIAAMPRPSEIQGLSADDAPAQTTPRPLNAIAPATPHVEVAEQSAAADAGSTAASAVSTGSSADLRKGEDMMLRWKQLGVDIAEKRLKAAGEYYARGNLLRARACYAQVAGMERPLDRGDDDATSVLNGLVGKAKSMLVRIDSARSLGSNESSKPSHMSDAPTTVSKSAADTEQGVQCQNDEGSADDSTSKDDIFLSVCKAFFSAGPNDDDAPPSLSSNSVQSPESDGLAPKAPIESAKLDTLFHEGAAKMQDEDTETRSAYSAKDIEDMANDIVSRRSEGQDRSDCSSIASTSPSDVDNLQDDDNYSCANSSTDTPLSPPGSSLATSVGASDRVVYNGKYNNVLDSNLPIAITLLQEAKAPYTVPMAPPSNRGLIASDSTLSDSLNASDLRAHNQDFQKVTESNSQQSAGSDTSEVASRPPSRNDSIEELWEQENQVVPGAEEVVTIARDNTATGEATNEPSQRNSAESLPQSASHDKLEQEAAEANEPVIYLRNSISGLSLMSDMVESTASSWVKTQAGNSSRENSTNSKDDGANTSLTIVGEELVIEDGLDPTEALKRASEQERMAANRNLEEQVDAIEREAAKRKEEKKILRNTKDSQRLHDQGMVYYDQGDFDHARSCFASALKMRFQVNGQSSLDTCLTQEKLGDTLVKLDKIEEAHWQYLMAFRGLQQCNLPKDNPHMPRILISLGDVFFSAADYSRALKYYEKSLRFRAETNSSDVCGGLMKCALGEFRK